jgi:uncharacterized protein (TIGR02118 family)
MIKLVVLIKRRADVSPEAFRRHYELEHAPLFARSIPPEVADAIIYYAQNHAVALGAGEAPFDCVTEFGFDDVEALRRWTSWYQGDGGRVLREDERRFMDTSERVVIVTEERRLEHR